jgi:hypothetical protein
VRKTGQNGHPKKEEFSNAIKRDAGTGRTTRENQRFDGRRMWGNVGVKRA